jgi:hypothetical protein
MGLDVLVLDDSADVAVVGVELEGGGITDDDAVIVAVVDDDDVDGGKYSVAGSSEKSADVADVVGDMDTDAEV